MAEYLGMEIRDLNRKCSGSVFTYGDTDDFYRLDSVAERGESDRGREVSILVPNVGTNTWEARRVGFDIFDNTSTRFPQVGYVNCGKASYHLARLASRQWHIGYNSAVVKLDDTFSTERNVLGLMSTDIAVYSPIFLTSVFNRQYPSFDESVELVASKRVLSSSPHPHLCISQSLEYDSPILLYKNKVVGFIQDNNIPLIFSPAEYVEKIIPSTRVDIMEVKDSASFRNKWY